MTPNIKVETPSGVLAVMFAFWLFWIANGFVRVDCALHIEKACEVLKAAYDQKTDKK